ncbi:M57 family metalloprotease [Nocardioides sp. C4-1]|uniref:M57 family metalloprotease n=1 Tax=Nocardioides sp. C4-1 TaxID=3151851 RepID=UPI003267833B
MKLTSWRTALLGATVCAALVAVPTANVAADDAKTAQGTAPSFEKFEATTYRDTDGAYVVNGDEALHTVESLRDYYDRMTGASSDATGTGTGTPSNGLIVNTTGGRDDKWTASQARNLTYCVSNNFGTRKTTVVNAMAQGAALWENASSGVNFTYVSSQDGSCRTRNTSVTFSVEPTTSTSYIARAFFPSYPKSQRNVLVNSSSLTTSGWSPANILGHELGHVLGFRHEHTRPESGACFEDNNWRPLTPYDSASIMHYPQCNGTSSSLSFTTRDGQGLRSLYGS